MAHTDEKQERSEAVINIKANDPVRDPAASTTNEDIARAEGEGMLPAPAPRGPLPSHHEGKAKRSRKAGKKARR